MGSITAAEDTREGPSGQTAHPAAWGAIYAMALCTFTLIASEFMPVSLLSPIAHELNLTEGQAGQAIAISGVFAVLTSLFLTRIVGRADRRQVLLALTALLILSGGMVAFAPTYPVLMIGRAFLGIAIGGFWSMSAAIVMRLVPKESIAKGLSIINGGNAIAATVSAPLGSLMGGLIGWRGAFFAVVPIAVAAVFWLAISLPSLPAEDRADSGSMMALLRRPPVMVGLLGIMLLFMGQFALYTYLRPFLEQVTHVSLTMLSSLLFVVGLAGFVGTTLIGRFLDHRLPVMLGILPAVMAAVAAGLAVFGGSTPAVAALLAIWGFAGTAAPVAWSTWLTRTLPHDAEAGGGLMVAVIQLAITLGATAGGLVFDAAGPAPAFLGAAAILGLGALVAFASSVVHSDHVPASAGSSAGKRNEA